MRKYLVLCLVAFVTADYGHYCGLGHGDIYGREPVDELDRVCQIHDICVSATAYLACFCNEQLYASMSQFNFLTTEQEAEIDHDLNRIYLAIAGCDNIPYLRELHVFRGCVSDDCDISGFTYLPIYAYNSTTKFVYLFTASNVKVLTMTRYEYDNYFTRQAYVRPNTIWTSNEHYRLMQLTSGWYPVRPGEVLVFVPSDSHSVSNVFFTEYDNIASGMITSGADAYNSMYEAYIELDQTMNDMLDSFSNYTKSLSDLTSKYNDLQHAHALQNDEISHLHLYYSYKYEGYPAFLVAPDPRAYLTLIIMTVTLPVLMIGVIGYLLYRLRQKVTMMPVSQVEELLPLERDGVEGEAEQE